MLLLLRSRGPTSRPQLARRMGASLPTVGNLVKELRRDGLICDVGQAGSTGGRRPVLVGVNPEHMQAVGATVSNRRIAVGRFDFAGSPVGQTVRADVPPGGPAALVEAVAAALEPLAGQAGGRLGGVGIGLSGLVDEGRGVCRYLFSCTDDGPFALAGPLAERFGVPVRVVNDVHAATLAECRFGAGRQHEDFLYLHVGRGIGLGMVLGGRVYSGAAGHGGELGHTVADPTGPVCYCGNYGCLESVAGPPAIVRQALAAIEHGVQSSISPSVAAGGELRIDTIFAAAAAGDRLASNLLEKAGEHLGLAAANVANVLEPTCLVLGGLLAGASAVLIETIRRVFLARRLPLLKNGLDVLVSAIGPDAGCRGAAEAVFDRVVLGDAQRLPGRRTDR